MNNKLFEYINSSFLSPLFMDDNITDISYNGSHIFYQHNKIGRQKCDFTITFEEALDFIRQIANMAEKQFSYTVPFLDISIGKFRINAVHPSLVRVNNDKSISFSIRIASSESKIIQDKNFMDDKAKKIIEMMIDNNESIVIAGATGSGKTELQKYLLSTLKNNTRIIIIDNIQELEYVRLNENLDVTSWQINPSSNEGTFEELIRNALRSNPDYLIIAESRGKEMNDVLNSAMTGHPIISTIHAKEINMIPHRMAKMIEMSNSTQTYEEIIEDVLEHITNYIILKKIIRNDGVVVRYIDKIARANLKTKGLDIIYRKEEKDEIN